MRPLPRYGRTVRPTPSCPAGTPPGPAGYLTARPRPARARRALVCIRVVFGQAELKLQPWTLGDSRDLLDYLHASRYRTIRSLAANPPTCVGVRVCVCWKSIRKAWRVCAPGARGCCNYFVQTRPVNTNANEAPSLMSLARPARPQSSARSATCSISTSGIASVSTDPPTTNFDSNRPIAFVGC